MSKAELYDMHAHSRCSHDSEARVLDMALACKEKGVSGLAITDHCDVQFGDTIDYVTLIGHSVREAQTTKCDGVQILSGVELGESIWNMSYAKKVISAHSYDVIIGSVHAVRYEGYTQPYSTIDFSKMTESELDGYMNAYFDDLLETARTLECDIIAHLTCPLRYINGKYSLGVDSSQYREKILEILKTIIARSVSLEVNTSGLGTRHDSLMPEKWILQEYKRLGGCLITLGADAHAPQGVAKGFDSTVALLKELGFDGYYYYEQRKPNRVSI